MVFSCISRRTMPPRCLATATGARWGPGGVLVALPDFRRTSKKEVTFISLDADVRMLEASADDLGCPDFGLRLSHWQGLHTLGPIAVIARNALTLSTGSRRSRVTLRPFTRVEADTRVAHSAHRSPIRLGGNRTWPSRDCAGPRDQHGDRCPDHPPAGRSGGASSTAPADGFGKAPRQFRGDLQKRGAR
jgi:hypothetical protein